MITTPEPGRSLAVATAATALTLLDVTVVYLALPDVGSDLGATFAELQWVIDAYAVAVAATLLAFGALADRRGRRAVFLFGLLVFAVASAGCAAAPDGLTLDLARAAQGVGAAALLATSLALIGAAYSGSARARALGIWGGVSGAALAAGPVLGGVIIDGLGWRWVFIVNLPLVLAIGVVALRSVPESRDPDAAPPDLAGAAVFTAGLSLLVAGLLRGPAAGWQTTPTIVMLATGAVLLAGFVVLELRRHSPLLSPRLFAERGVGSTTAVAFLQSVAIYPVLLFMTIELQLVFGFSPLEAGVRVLPVTLTLLVAAALSGRLTGRVGYRPPVVAGLLGTAAGLLLLRGVNVGEEWTALLPGFLVLGTAMGVLSPGLAAAIMDMRPVQEGGLASGLGNTARQVGIAAGVAILGAVLAAAAPSGTEIDALLSTAEPRPGAAAAYLTGMDSVLAVAAGFALAGALAALALPGTARAVPSSAAST